MLNEHGDPLRSLHQPLAVLNTFRNSVAKFSVKAVKACRGKRMLTLQLRILHIPVNLKYTQLSETRRRSGSRGSRRCRNKCARGLSRGSAFLQGSLAENQAHGKFVV